MSKYTRLQSCGCGYSQKCYNFYGNCFCARLLFPVPYSARWKSLIQHPILGDFHLVLLVSRSFCTVHYTVRVGSNRMVRGTNFKICGSGHSNECVKSTCLRWCSIFEKMSEDPSRLNHFEDSIILPYGLVSKIFSMFAKQKFHSFFLVCISRPLQVYLRT